MPPWSPSAPTRYRFLFNCFTLSVVPNILVTVPKKKLPLSSTHPKLAKEVDGWDPNIWVNDRLVKKAWICTKGHRYLATIKDRKSGSGCPICGRGNGGRKSIPGINDLATIFPEIAKEANGWDPKLYLPGSNQKLAWVCKFGHKWNTAPSERTKGKGCPFCSGHRPIVGETDLLTNYPEIAEQAYGWDPRTVTSGSGKKLEWICSQNHIWKTTVHSRTSGTGCPYCSGRLPIIGKTDLLTLNPALAAEADGWNPQTVTKNSGKKMNWRCKENHRWIATVDQRQKNGCPYCSGHKPIVGENDLKTLFPKIASQADGWNPEEFLPKSNQMKSWICSKGHRFKALIATRTDKRATGTGCPYCSGRRVIVGETDLLTINPKLAAEAFGWDPSKVSPGSDKKLAWICSLGHTWMAVVHSRSSNTGCPVCSNQKVLAGFNDLATTHPHIASQAENWDPTTVSSGSSNRNYLWKCPDGHMWKSNVKNRTVGQGCPTCAVSGFDPNSNGFLYFIRHDHWEMFQIGITNFPDSRLGNHSKSGWEIIELRGPMDGHLTQQWETAILRMLKAKGADLSNEKIAGKFDGYSEAWSKSTFEVKSIKELMRLTEEFEEKK